MDYFHSLIMGFMQGLTEFLPVSSSGHLVITSAIYKIFTGQEFTSTGQEEIFFDIMLHVGTLVAVVIYFRKDIKEIFEQFFVCLKKRDFKGNYLAQLPFYILAGTFVTGALIYPVKDMLEALTEKPDIVGLLIMCTGFILLLSEFISKKIPVKTDEVSLKKALLIGLAQGLAATPGISRSGSTIAAALALGVDRKTAGKFSFLLSIPIILLALFVHSMEMSGLNEIANFAWGPIIAGTVLAAVTGYFCIKYFIAFLSKFSLDIFAYYCLSVGLAAFVYFRFFA
ncbi:MAG: undecaprenyl-diphosphate phosphatase [Candidatus Gastranaerophilales bacterium]|nr:undecaprenyl-diphosphate phosphatase [Candidatus Gastranaerophilales bacterium]